MHARDLQRAAHILRQGGVVAYATEHCFGLGCDPFNRAAVLRLLHIKRRSMAKGLIVLAGDVEQLGLFAERIPAEVTATWPGPHTWLLATRVSVPKWITGAHPRVAVRVTAHRQAAALCHAAGMAIVSTSANRAGEQPARTDREVRRRFGKLVDYVLPGFVGGAPAPTPIRDAVTGERIRD
jgi:L-threonylcarbamoyladenylate synthase